MLLNEKQQNGLRDGIIANLLSKGYTINEKEEFVIGMTIKETLGLLEYKAKLELIEHFNTK